MKVSVRHEMNFEKVDRLISFAQKSSLETYISPDKKNNDKKYNRPIFFKIINNGFSVKIMKKVGKRLKLKLFSEYQDGSFSDPRIKKKVNWHFEVIFDVVKLHNTSQDYSLKTYEELFDKPNYLDLQFWNNYGFYV